MRKYSVVVLLLAAILLALPVVAAAQADWAQISQEFDNQARLEIGGPKGERFVTSGPEYDRLQSSIKKIGTKIPYYLVNDEAYEAGASVNACYVALGMVKASTDAELIFGCGHVEGYIIVDLFALKWDAAMQAGQVEKALRDAAKAVDQPGTRENARMVADWGRFVGSFPVFQYTQDDVYAADKWAALTAMRYDFKPEAFISYFDKPFKAGIIGKSLLGRIRNDPSPSRRKARAQKVAAERAAEQVKAATITPAAIGKKRVEIDTGPWLEMVKDRKFDGFAFKRFQGDRTTVYALVAGGSGEMASSKGSAILPKNANTVTLVFVNPKPENMMNVIGRVAVGAAVILEPQTGYDHIGCIAVTYPAEIMTASDLMYFVGIADGPGPSAKLNYDVVMVSFKAAK